jgi:hypothetical protein
MAGFDAELYLRLEGERQLLGRDEQQGHRVSPLELPAQALAAAGAIEPEVAVRVLADYSTAERLRVGERRFYQPLPRRRRARAGRLDRPRVAILECEIEFEGGRLMLRDIRITAKGAVVRFRWQRDRAQTSGQGVVLAGMHSFPWGQNAPVVIDDRGNRPAVSSGSGGGDDEHWDGTLDLGRPFAQDTVWLDVEGTRIMLDPLTAAYEIAIEPLVEETPLERVLWRRLAVGQHPFDRGADLEPAITALLAAGAVDPDSMMLRDLRAVAAALPDHPGHPHRTGTRRLGRLPQPWRSLLQRLGKDDGPMRSLVVGAVTPEFDGIQVAAHSVSSDRTSFEVQFEVAPDVLSTTFTQLPVAWWAHDDLANSYLGSPSSWGASRDHAEGTLRFWPALDPNAKRLELIPTADRHRAVISISMTDTTSTSK